MYSEKANFILELAQAIVNELPKANKGVDAAKERIRRYTLRLEKATKELRGATKEPTTTSEQD